jgi:hypothetical protein
MIGTLFSHEDSLNSKVVANSLWVIIHYSEVVANSLWVIIHYYLRPDARQHRLCNH